MEKNNVTKGEIISAIKEKIKEAEGVDIVSKASLEKIYGKYMEVLNDLIKQEKCVTLPNVGRLYTTRSKPRLCRNPKNGGLMTIPEKIRVKFKLSRTLDDSLNEGTKKAVS